jgi:hypothetical protein
MKRFFVLFLALAFLLVSCGQSKIIDGVEYKPIGVISMLGKKSNLVSGYSTKIQYEPCWGNIIWGVVLSETIIAPIYFYGFSMFNPVSVKDTIESN